MLQSFLSQLRGTLSLVVAISVLGLATGCQEDNSSDQETADSSIGPLVKCLKRCPETIEPVCGVDGETYDNACVAKCAGVEIDESGECLLCKFDLSEYRARGEQKVRLLNEYISIILNQGPAQGGIGDPIVDTAVNEAVRLFVNEEATVAVSGRQTKYFTIREYLQRIRNYTYGKVEISWSKIGYVSELKKGPDGNYYGVISITQIFRGYVENQPVYEDVTVKNIEVVLKPYAMNAEGKVKLDCEVFLSDIGVKDTRML
ncbi:MAG: Kazal-type serine protease inhibitor family protein [Bacteroidota bacterium]